MLITFKKEKDGLFKGVCTCGEVFYVKKPLLKVRCLECLLKNKAVKANKSEIRDVKRRLKVLINNICKRDEYGN